MPTLAEARAKLPQYAGLTDENLLGAIQRNFYPDKPLEAVAKHFGVKLAPPPAPEVASRSFGQVAGDTLVRGARGAVSGVKMFTDLAGANNPVSGALNDAQQGLGNMLSPQAQEIARQRAAAIDQANTSGSTWDQVKAYGGSFLDDPIGSTVEGIGSAVPTIAATLATGGAAPAASIAARGLPFVVGAAQGAGAVKGSIYEETKRELLKAGVPAEEAEQRAAERQTYAMSGSQIAAGAGLGAVAGKLGESVIANPASGGIRRRVLMGAAQEAPTEAAQGAQEQYAVNTALNAEGLNVAPMRGVLGAGVAEGITGGAVGGAFGLARARTPGDEIRDANKVPEVGPLSRAENLGVESVAAKVDAVVPVMPPMPAMPAQAPEALTQAREPVQAPATPAAPPLPPAPFPLDMVPEGQADPMEVLARQAREDENALRVRDPRRPAAPQVARQPEAGPPEPTIDEALSRMAAVQVEPPAPIEPPPYLDALAEKDQRDAQTRALYGTMGKPSPILNREGKPFTTRIAANRKAAEVGGEVEKVEGGFIVNPPTPADATEVTPPASPVTTQEATDVPGARDAAVEADGVDLSHLRALESRLANERERLDRSKSPSERRAREVTVRGILREIEGERKLLGIPDQQAQGAEDDALLDALGATQAAPEPGAAQGAGRDTEPTSTTTTQAQAVTPAEVVGLAGDSEPSESAGLRVYPIKVKNRDTGEIESKWAVQTPENAEREIGGDPIVASRQEASAEAIRLRNVYEREQKQRYEREAAEADDRRKEEARKAASRGKSVLERRANAVLDRPVREGEEQMTRRQWVERKVAEGLKARITQEDRIKPMSRMAYFRASNEEQRAHERKVKEAGKKDTYWIGDYEVSKIEHDYAQRLIAERGAKPAEAATTSQGRVESEAGDRQAQGGQPLEAAPEPAAPPVAKQARPRVTRFVTKNDMVGSAVEWQEQGADGAWNRLTTFDTMEAAKSSAASQGYDAEAIPRFVSEFSTTAKRFLPAVPEPKAPTQPTPTSAPPQAQQQAPNPQEQAAEPDALTLTPKQYHEARLRQMAANNGATLAEVQEMYDTEGGRAESNVLWSKAVYEAARGGAVLTRQTIDKLLELNPTARLPESAIPAGYQRHEARKQEAEAKEAVRQDRREAKAARQAAPGAQDGATITRAQESALYDFLKQQIGDDSVRYELIAKKFRRAADGTASDEDAKITSEWLEGMRVDGDERQRLAAEGRAKAEADAADSEHRAAEKSAESLADLRSGKAGNERYRLFLSTLAQAERDAKQSASDFNVAFMSFIGARSGEFRRQQRSDQINDQDAFTAYIREWVSKRTQPATAFDQFKATMRAIYDGTASLEDYKAAYRRVRDGDAVKAELNKLTKDELIRTFGIMARPDEKKDSLVATAYKSMLRGFALGKQYGPSSYMMTRGGLENFEKQKAEALDAIVEGHTAEDLAAYAAEVAKERAEVSAKRAARAEAIADPKTLEDFRAFLNVKMSEGLSLADARRAMTLEQRAAYDALEAETTRERREKAKQADRQVRAAGQQVAGSIIETKHTRDGYPLFVVQLGERVSREDYMTLLASAKKLGGWYSSFRGSGAVPGFQFKARAEAEAFTALAGGDAQAAQEQAQARRDAFQDDKSQSAAERLTEMADRLKELADESLNRERKVNTQRRAGMAAAAEKEAREQKAFATTMRNLAEAITAGRVQFLDRVREKAQVGMLRRILANAKDAELRAKYPTYAEQEKRKGQPATVETVDYAEFPSFTAMRSDLASLARQLLEVDGTKKVGERLMKVADDVSAAFSEWVEKPGNWSRVARFVVKDTGQRAGFKSKVEAEAAIRRGGFRGKAMPWSIKRGEWTIITTPSEAIAAGLWEGDGDKRITLSQEFGQELVDTIGRRANKANRLSVPWQFETAADRLKALARMGIETPAEFRSALREFITMNEQAAEADRVKELERAMVGRRNDGLDFFPTPEDVADQMVEAAEIGPEMEVLEPSAGMGHIADRIREAGAEPTVVEMDEARRELLAAKGYRLDDTRDFLNMEPRRFFTFGDVFRAPDGTEGVMMGSGGMASNRVMLRPLQADGTPDMRRGSWYNRDELDGVSFRGSSSGYDRILMNPPFSNGRDIDHVRHAYTLLKPGGRIVALMGESAFTNQSKKATEFREWLESVGGTDEKLPAGSFMDPSLPVTTGANARMVVINKPEDAPAFSRTPTQTQPLAVQSAVDRIKATWANAPKVNVVSSMQDPAVPEKVRAEDAKQRQGGANGSPRGFFYEGEVYVVADAIRSEADVATVMAHEALGHFGLRQTFGPGLGRVLDLIASSRQDLVSAKAKAYGLPVNVLQARRILAARGITGEEATAQAARMVQKARETAAEEVLAEMAEKRPNLGIVRRAVAAIRAWMRENIPGLADLKLSDDEIIRDFILPARQFVEQGGAEIRGGREAMAFQRVAIDGDDTDRAFTETDLTYGGRAAYDRARAAGQTKLTYGQWVHVRTPQFKTWFGDWEALRSNEDANAAIQRWAGGEMKSGELVQMGRPSEVLQRFGVPDLPIHLTQRVLSKAVRQKHDVDVADLKDLALNIQAPLAVFASKHGASHRVLVTEARHADGNVIVALELAKVRGELEVNDITSIHPKRDGSIANWVTDGLLLGYAKGNGRDWLENSAGSNSQQPQAKAAIDGAIVYDVSRVSNASKVLDPDTGEPMVVFHGTDADFSKFSDRKLGENTDGNASSEAYAQTARVGFWFNTQPMAGPAAGYTVDMPVHLSIKNPKRELSLDWLAQGLESTKGRAYRKQLMADGYDGIVLRDEEFGGESWVAFRPEQIKSATGNRGTFDGSDPDIRFSRTLGEAVSSALNDARDAKLPAGYVLDDLIRSSGRLNWWQKTVGTPAALAKKYPAFRLVFDEVQEFLTDVSHYATQAADKAPRLLPKLESFKDLTKTAISSADNKAIQAPIFEGTLNWMRDSQGRPVKVEDAMKEVEGMSTEDKAQALLVQGRISEGVLRMWQGMALDAYTKAVNGKYEAEFVKAGIVWKPQELRELFGLTGEQIGLYKEFRAATDESLRSMALAEMMRLAGRQQEMRKFDGLSLTEARDMLADEARSNDPDAADKIATLANRAQDLMDRGYAPLTRFGKYSLDVVDGDGTRVYFGLFESEREANRMARKMRASFPAATMRQGTMPQETFKLLRGVNQDTIEVFGDILGLDKTGDEAADRAFQAFLKNAIATRSAMRRLIHRKGIAGYSDDVTRVLAGFVYSNARRTSSQLHAGAIKQAAKDIENERGQGELADYATKLDDYVSNPAEEARGFRSLLFFQYLGGSVASALVNMTQPVGVTFPYLSQFTTAGKAGKAVAGALSDMASRKALKADLAGALARAEKDGIVSPQEVFQLQALAQGSGGLTSGDGTLAGDAAATGQNLLLKGSLAWGKLFGFAEQVNRRASFIAAYRVAQDKGMADPERFARDTVEATQFIYNKGNKPQWARGAVGSILFTFKTYSVNYIELLAQMARSGPDGKKAALLALAVLFLMSGADEFPFMEDVEDVIDGVAQRAFGLNWSTKQARNELMVSILGQGWARFVAKGVSGIGGAPIDLSGRLGMGNLIPGTGLFQVRRDATNDVVEIAGPAGDLIKRGFQATGLALQGEIGKAAEKLLPVAGQNIQRAAEMATTGYYRDAQDRNVVETSPLEAVVKGAGFQPNTVARVQDATRTVQRAAEVTRLREAEIASKWAQGVADNDPDKVQEAKDELARWNRRNPETPIRINRAQILKRVRNIRATKAERVINASPRELRNLARRELEAP